MRRPQRSNQPVSERGAQLPMQPFRRTGSLAEQQLDRVEISRQTLVPVLSDLRVHHRRPTPSTQTALATGIASPAINKRSRSRNHSFEGPKPLDRGTAEGMGRPPSRRSDAGDLLQSSFSPWGSERARVQRFTAPTRICTFARSNEVQTSARSRLLSQHEQEHRRSNGDQRDVRDGPCDITAVAFRDTRDAEVDPLVTRGDATAAHAAPGDLVSLHVLSRNLTTAVEALVPAHDRSLGRLRAADYWTNG